MAENWVDNFPSKVGNTQVRDRMRETGEDRRTAYETIRERLKEQDLKRIHRESILEKKVTMLTLFIERYM